MIVFRTTKVNVKILRKIDDMNFVIQYGKDSITSCRDIELLFLN